MSNVLRVQRSAYLSIPRHTLIHSLITTQHDGGKVTRQITQKDAEDWQLFTRAMSFIVNCSYASVAEAMRKHAWEEEMLIRASKDSGQTGKELERAKLHGQMRYMQRLMSLVTAAQYSPLKQHHWDFGVARQNYSSGQQVEVDIKMHSNALFPEYFRTSEDQGGGPYWFGPDCDVMEGKPHPDFANYVLVFFRGTRELTEKGMFIWDKIRYIFDSVEQMFKAIGRLLRLRKRGGGRHSESNVFDDVTNSGSATIHEAETFKRVTVETHMSSRPFFSTFFSQLELSEPAFQSLIVVYPSPEARLSGAAALPSAGGAAGAVGSALMRQGSGKTPAAPAAAEPVPEPVLDEEPVADDSEVSRVLRVEMFERIPFRDLGLVIPGRHVQIGFKHKLRFTLQLGLYAVFIILCLLNIELANSTRNWIVVSFLVMLVVRCVQVAQSISVMRAGLRASINDWLDQRRVASDNPCVARLMKQVEEQELKEIFLGYFFLWKRLPEGLSKRELDYEAETFLFKIHNLKVDFDVEDALKKLKELRLIEESGGKFRCVRKPREYLDDPRPRWLDFFHSFGEASGGDEHAVSAPPRHRHGHPEGLRRRGSMQGGPQMTVTSLESDSIAGDTLGHSLALGRTIDSRFMGGTVTGHPG